MVRDKDTTWASQSNGKLLALQAGESEFESPGVHHYVLLYPNLAEETGLDPVQSEFESLGEHQT